MIKTSVKVFVEKIRQQPQHLDGLIKVENFSINNTYTGYLYAYHTPRGVHIDAGVSSGTPCFKDLVNYSDMFCAHTLHEYLYKSAVFDTDNTLESRIEELLRKTMEQLIILETVERKCRKNSVASIL